MALPVRDPRNLATDHPGRPEPSDFGREASAPLAVAVTDDLDRLQTCLDWLNRERMLLALAATDRKAPRRLPRAAQLDPVPGIAPPTDGRREKLPFVLAPPLACDRLQPPLPGRSRFSGTMLLVLAAAVLAGSIAYHVSDGFFSLPGVAQAALLETPAP